MPHQTAVHQPNCNKGMCGQAAGLIRAERVRVPYSAHPSYVN